MLSTPPVLFEEIKDLIKNFNPEKISKERKTVLKPLTQFIQSKIVSQQAIRINFICTHNSRRSHLSQVWAQTLGYYFNIKNLFCYSAGTESTALFPMVAKTLEKSGFGVKVLSEGNNPIYCIKYAKNEAPIIGFSKKLDTEFNPESDFAAVMTCSQAENDCPFIAGAEKRISIPFEDPKVFDNTAQQALKYQERSLEIANELFYIFSQIDA